MTYNWQLPDWPNFTFDVNRFARLEDQFRQQAGVLIGTTQHLSDSDKKDLTIALLADEATQTSSIEGEVLNRESVRLSIAQKLGLRTPRSTATPAEQGVANVMVDLFQDPLSPLQPQRLFAWHNMLLEHAQNVHPIGAYRTSSEPMQIVSTAYAEPQVHYEAPPSQAVPAMMARFFAFLEDTHPSKDSSLPPLVRAALAHIYFESIHAFEDGNGRLGRVIIEHTLAQSLETALITGISPVLNQHKKQYYQELSLASRHLDMNRWIDWFARAALQAQSQTLAETRFIIEKTKLLDRLKDELNPRQEKTLVRMAREGAKGFAGGLSAANYMDLTKATASTASRDLADLVDKQALRKTGQLKGTRYHLNISVPQPQSYMSTAGELKPPRRSARSRKAQLEP